MIRPVERERVFGLIAATASLIGTVATPITLGLARSLKGQKRFVAAQEAYNRIVRRGKRAGDSAAFEKAVDDAVAEKDEIAKLIGSLTINVKGAEKPSVTLDGARFAVGDVHAPKASR